MTASLAFVQGDSRGCRVATAKQACRSFAGWETTGTGSQEHSAFMALSALALGDADRARALAEEAVQVRAALGRPDDRGVRRATSPVSCLPGRGELDEAERLIEESVRDARELGNVRSVGAGRGRSAGSRSARRDYARARPLFEESLATPPHARRPVGDLALALGARARGARRARRQIGAAPAGRERRDRAVRAGDRPSGVFNLEVCAGLAAAEGRRPNAPSASTDAQASLRGSMGTGIRSKSAGPTPHRTSPSSAPRSARKLRRGLGAGTRDDVG